MKKKPSKLGISNSLKDRVEKRSSGSITAAIVGTQLRSRWTRTLLTFEMFKESHRGGHWKLFSLAVVFWGGGGVWGILTER